MKHQGYYNGWKSKCDDEHITVDWHQWFYSADHNQRIEKKQYKITGKIDNDWFTVYVHHHDESFTVDFKFLKSQLFVKVHEKDAPLSFKVIEQEELHDIKTFLEEND